MPPQDVVHEDLTVRENLVYSARLRLSAGKALRDKLALVDDCVELLQLRHVQHQVVGSVECRGIRCAGATAGQRSPSATCCPRLPTRSPRPTACPTARPQRRPAQARQHRTGGVRQAQPAVPR